MCRASHAAERNKVPRTQAVDTHEGQGLVTKWFGKKSDRFIAFVDPKTPNTVVCLLPQTKLSLCVPREIQRQFNIESTDEVTLIEVEHHDAIRFSNGPQLDLVDLGEGVLATVTAVPTSGSRTPELETAAA